MVLLAENETLLLNPVEVQEVLAMAISLYDNSDDFWFAYRPDIDVNVYETHDTMYVTAYKYNSELMFVDTDKYQSLLKASIYKENEEE